MTAPRLVAIGFIYVCTTIAWFVLGGTIVARTGEKDSELRGEVEQLWGGEHSQRAPSAWFERAREELREEIAEDGRRVTRPVRVVDRIPVPIVRSRVNAALELDYRRKGLLWYDTYRVRFTGDFLVRNTDTEARDIHVHFAFPSATGIYDDFRYRVDGRDAPPVDDLSAGAMATVRVPPGSDVPVEVRYVSRGLDRWAYVFGDGVAQVRDFGLVLGTDFRNVDFPPGSISPNTRSPAGRGERIAWRFASLVTGQRVAVDLPARLNPGPLAARISFFAPVSLLFFVTVLVIQGVLRGRSLHPMNYLFLSAAFFAFHLLLAYLVDHVDIHVAFAISAASSVFLVLTYLRLAAGQRKALLEAALAQVVYLVLFGYAFFFEGYTGLTVTIGAVVTLFVLMQITGRVPWADVFAKARSS